MLYLQAMLALILYCALPALAEQSTALTPPPLSLAKHYQAGIPI